MTVRRGILWLALATAAAAGQGRVIVLLGPPGAGKSTQAKALSRELLLPAISAAELLKKSHGKKDQISRALKVPLASGELVNEETLNQLVEARVAKRDALGGFILDGYPVSPGQGEFLGALVKTRGLAEPVILHLQAPDAVVKQRMQQRGRADDLPAVIERRIADYRRFEQTVLDHYAKGKLHHIDATKSEKEITGEIRKLLGLTPR